MAKRPIIFDPIPTRRIFEEIVGQIRQRIYDGELKPGDRLPGERDLAIQFGVGLTVVREALRTLEEGGLVQIKKGSDGGAFVKKADSSVATRSLTTLIHLGLSPSTTSPRPGFGSSRSSSYMRPGIGPRKISVAWKRTSGRARKPSGRAWFPAR